MRSRRRRCRWAQVHHMIRYVSSRRRQRASNAPTKARIHATYATSWGENVLEQRSTATPTSSGDVSGSPPRRREPREHILAYLSVAVDAAVRLRAVPRPRAGRVGASRRLWERRAGGSGRTSRACGARRCPLPAEARAAAGARRRHRRRRERLRRQLRLRHASSTERGRGSPSSACRTSARRSLVLATQRRGNDAVFTVSCTRPCCRSTSWR